MGINLKDYIKEHACHDFIARAHYFQEGDFVSYYVKDEPAYEERIDELMTVYRSMKTNEMVGCKIKGVERILSELGSLGLLGVLIQDNKVCLGIFDHGCRRR